MNHSSAAHLLWLVIGRATRSVFLLAAVVVTASHLGPHRFGLVNFAISLTMLLALFPGAGLDSILTRELVRRPDERPIYLGSAFALYFCSSALCYLLLITLSLLVTDTRSVWLLVVVCGLSYVPRSSSLLTAFFDSQLAGRYVMLAESIQAITGLAIRLLLVWRNASPLAFAIAWVADWAIFACAQFVFFSTRFPRFRCWRVSWHTTRELARRVFPLAMSGAMILVYQQVDKIMLKIMIDVDTVGHYSLALRFVYAGVVVPILGVRAVAPKLFAARERDASEYDSRGQHLHDVVTWMSLLIMLALIVTAPLLPLICGQDYAAAVAVMIAAAPVVLGATMGAASGQQMVAEDLQKLAPLRNALGCGVNIILNLLLIPHLKGLGAALATVSASLTASFFCMALIPQCRHIFRMQSRAVLTGPVRLVPIAVRHIRRKR